MISGVHGLLLERQPVLTDLSEYLQLKQQMREGRAMVIWGHAQTADGFSDLIGCKTCNCKKDVSTDKNNFNVSSSTEGGIH